MVYRGLNNPWPHRHFIVQAVKIDIKRQFARSTLGALWLILHPLARAAIFAVVFSELLVVRMPGLQSTHSYAIYLMAGMAAWGLFGDIVTRSTAIFIEYSGMIKKAPMSHFCAPAVACGGALFSHLVLLVVIAVVTVLLDEGPWLAWLALIPGGLILMLFGAGLGVLLGILNVFRRDVAQLTGIVLQVWFWLTPIVYIREAIPKKYAWIIDMNPLVPVIRIYQDAIVYGAWPAPDGLVLPLIYACTLFLAAIALLQRASGDMVDAL